MSSSIRRGGAFWADGDRGRRGSPRNFNGVGESEEVVPGARLAGKDDVAGFGILADEDFLRRETEIGRQTDSLAAAVLKSLAVLGMAHPDNGSVETWSIP